MTLQIDKVRGFEADTAASGRSFISTIMSRRSASPKRLAAPGPSMEEIELMIVAAITAPDHGELRPWRFLLIPAEAREALGRVFAAAKARRDPDAPPEEIERERARAHRAPLLIGIIARLDRENSKVSVQDQYASVGAAMQNLLLGAHALGYGAKMLSGRKTFDAHVTSALGLAADEELIGFVCMGRPTVPPEARPRPRLRDHFSVWPGPPAT